MPNVQAAVESLVSALDCSTLANQPSVGVSLSTCKSAASPFCAPPAPPLLLLLSSRLPRQKEWLPQAPVLIEEWLPKAPVLRLPQAWPGRWGVSHLRRGSVLGKRMLLEVCEDFFLKHKSVKIFVFICTF